MEFDTLALGNIDINIGDRIRVDNSWMTVHVICNTMLGVSIDGVNDAHDLGGILSDRSGKFLGMRQIANIDKHIPATEPIETACPVCSARVSSANMVTKGRYVVCERCADSMHMCTCCGTPITYRPPFNKNGHILCSACAREKVYVCNCTERFMVDDGGLLNVRILGHGARHFCPSCAEHIELPETYDANNLVLRHCDNCGKYVHMDLAHSIHGRHHSISSWVCSACHEALPVCEECGSKTHTRKTDPENGKQICLSCFHEKYVTCSHCGVIEMRKPKNYKGEMCRECRKKNRYGILRCKDGCSAEYSPNHYMNSYSYKPEPFMFPKVDIENPIYFGVELEVDREVRHPHTFDAIADKIVSHVPYAYVKRDGSLHNGVEIVTHPATIDYHCVDMKQNWANLFTFLKNNDFAGHSPGTCGLHIHVSSRPLGVLGKDVVEKLIYVWAKYWEELVVFSRRDVRNYNQMHWANKIHVDNDLLFSENDEQYVKNRMHGISKTRRDRYHAINLNNRNTIEFRLFRSTLQLDTFIATLQLVDVAVKKCLKHTFSELREMSWEEFTQSDYKELNEYLESRKKVGSRSDNRNWIPEDEDSPNGWEWGRIPESNIALTEETALDYENVLYDLGW